MPEYSSTTITPSDGVQVPSMNGSTSGNFLLSALKSYILAEKGQANGLASLGSDGKLTAAQLPDLADDVIVATSYATLDQPGMPDKLYITADTNKMYRWDPDLATPDYVELSVDLSAYATKAELAAEESARESEDSNLKSAIQANSNRISNLEQEHGGYIPVQYRGTNNVPPNKAKYALVESIVGKSRAWNQLIPTVTVSTTKKGMTITSNNDGTFTISGTTNDEGAFDLITNVGSTLAGHKYFLGLGITVISGSAPSGTTYAFRWGDGMQGNPWCTADTILTGNLDKIGTEDFMMNVYATNVSVNITIKPIFRDLTLIFPEGVPSTVAECVQKCPDILKYDAYGYSLVDTVMEGVESVGLNVIDGVFENGSIDATNGQDQANNNFVRTKNYNPIQPSTAYYFKIPSTCYAFWYDANKNYISYTTTVNGSNYSSPSNAFFMRLVSVTKPYGNDIQVCLNSLDSAVKQTYHTPMESTLTLPSSVTLRSAGTVAEVYDLETGEKSNPIGSVDLGTLIWGGSSATYWYATIADMKQPLSSDAIRLLCAKYPVSSPKFSGEVEASTSEIICQSKASGGANNFILCKASSSPTGTLYYELATPDDPTQLTPVIDNTIQTEGGGTINTIQNNVYPDESPAPTIDNSMDVGYLAL